jgi:ABC-type iron transport system FetAB permease component
MLGYSAHAIAGPIAVIGALQTMFMWYFGLVIVLSIGALILCKFIANRRLRALMRLFVIVFLYSPVYSQDHYTMAFLLAPGALFNSAAFASARGMGTHPFSLSYGIALAITLPLLVIGMWLLDSRRPSTVPLAD